MVSKPSAVTRRTPTKNLTPESFAAIWARTTPAKVLRSATPMPVSFSSAARSTNSSAWLAPRRKEKLVLTASSAYSVMHARRARTICPPRHKARRDKARSGGRLRLRRCSSRVFFHSNHATIRGGCVPVLRHWPRNSARHASGIAAAALPERPPSLLQALHTAASRAAASGYRPHPTLQIAPPVSSRRRAPECACRAGGRAAHSQDLDGCPDDR